MAIKATLTVKRDRLIGSRRRKTAPDYEACIELVGYAPLCHYGRSPAATAAGVVKTALEYRKREAASYREADPFAGYSKRNRKSRRMARAQRRR